MSCLESATCSAAASVAASILAFAAVHFFSVMSWGGTSLKRRLAQGSRRISMQSGPLIPYSTNA